MEKTPTAEEFAKNHHPMKTYPTDWNVMIEFAKLHVEAALKAASATLPYDDKMNQSILDTIAIKNSYPLDKIK